MKLYALILMALILAGSASNAQDAATERPTVARYSKVYRGDEGLTLSTLAIGKSEDEEYILQYSGINHDWNWKIFKARRVRSGTGFDYVIKHNGGDYATLIERGDTSDRARRQIFVPKIADGARVVYDESLSERATPEHYLTDYLEQEKGKPVKGAAWR